MNNRKIKFRAKKIDNDEWVHGSLIGDNVIVGEIVEWNSDYYNTEFWWKVDPETVCQFTGLVDRNGTEIYVSDILATSNDNPEYDNWDKEDYGSTVVEWDSKHASYNGSKWMWEFDSGSVYELQFVEIIGNIHDKQ